MTLLQQRVFAELLGSNWVQQKLDVLVLVSTSRPKGHN
jgi:hypothetical protein